MFKFIKGLLKLIIWAVLIVLSAMFVINFYVLKTGENYLYDINDVPQASHVLVFGASVYGNSVSDTLAKRLDTAFDVYKLKKAKKILVSGDHRVSDYNEVNAMKEYLVKKGVPESDILLDHSGLDTYDSVNTAKKVFAPESVIMVSQKVHIIRALYIGEQIGLKSYGVPCGNYNDSQLEYQKTREFFARIKAFIQCNIDKIIPDNIINMVEEKYENFN